MIGVRQKNKSPVSCLARDFFLPKIKSPWIGFHGDLPYGLRLCVLTEMSALHHHKNHRNGGGGHIGHGQGVEHAVLTEDVAEISTMGIRQRI